MGCIVVRGGKRRGATLKVRTHRPKSAQNGMAREPRLGIDPRLFTDRRLAGRRLSRNLKRLPPVAEADHAFFVGRRVVKGPLAAGLPGAGIERGLKSGVDPGHPASRQGAQFQQDLGDLVGKALSATGDQYPLRIFGIERRSWHAMLKQRPRAPWPVTTLDRLVA